MTAHRIAWPLIWVFALGLTAPEGLAQGRNEAQARIAAKANAAVPDGSSIAVDYRDDTLLNERLRTIFERALQDRGYRVGDKADFTLTFETLVEEKLNADKPATIFGSGGSKSGAEIGFELRLPLKKPKTAVGGRRYSLNVSLAKPGKLPVWVASAVAVAASGERLAIQSRMVEALVAVIGETVDPRPIQIE